MRIMRTNAEQVFFLRFMHRERFVAECDGDSFVVHAAIKKTVVRRRRRDNTILNVYTAPLQNYKTANESISRNGNVASRIAEWTTTKKREPNKNTHPHWIWSDKNQPFMWATNTTRFYIISLSFQMPKMECALLPVCEFARVFLCLASTLNWTWKLLWAWKIAFCWARFTWQRY